MALSGRRRLFRFVFLLCFIGPFGYFLMRNTGRYSDHSTEPTSSGTYETIKRPAPLKHPTGEFRNPPFTFTVDTPSKLANGCFLFITRSISLTRVRRTVFDVERRFNDRFNYPYVFLSEEEFTDDFKRKVQAMTSAKVEFGIISDGWGYPEWIDKKSAEKAAQIWADENDTEKEHAGYRHMVRYWASQVAFHPLLLKYSYVWRLEPGSHYTCDFEYDPILYMEEKNLTYGFAVSFEELPNSVPTLWSETRKFIAENKEAIGDNSLGWLFTKNKKNELEFNRCQFLTNFELLKLEFVRSSKYQKLFNYLDHAGGFYFEKWSDGAVRTIAAALFLPKSQLHWFSDIGYSHDRLQNCPQSTQRQMRCHCNPKASTHLLPMSCSTRIDNKSTKIDKNALELLIR